MAEEKENNDGYLSDCDIDRLKVDQLKKYLRKHNQYVSGKKTDLVLRARGVRKLGICDPNRQNNDAETELARRQCGKLMTPLGVKLPHPKFVTEWSMDLMEVPDFTERDIYNYFVLKMQTKKPLRSKIYYDDRHVYNIMYSGISDSCEHCFVRCKVMPSIPTANPKDSPDHDVWVCLSKVTGAVHSAECDCTAGNGEACNNIGALLHALSDVTVKKKDGTLASTSKKCQWDQFNNPRKRKLTPKKSSEISFRRSELVTEERTKSARELFSPKPVVIEDRFKSKLERCNPSAGWLLNFINKPVEDYVPQFLQIHFNFSDSVDLGCEEVKKKLSLVMSSMKLTESECYTVQNMTKGQTKNILWTEERRNRLTASNFGRVISLRETTAPEAAVKNILYDKVLNKYVIWGQKHEPAARVKYTLVMKKKFPDIKVQQSGLFVASDYPYLGASPDGVVTYTSDGITGQGVLEIKCPASDRWRNLSPMDCAKDTDFFSEVDTGTDSPKLKRNHPYYYQVQGQMALSGYHWCDFVIWTLGGISIERIEFEPSIWCCMVEKLKQFYQHAILPELFTRRIQRGLKLY